MLPQKIFKFMGSEMPIPVLSTGHFNKYERKNKWLEYILTILLRSSWPLNLLYVLFSITEI